MIKCELFPACAGGILKGDNDLQTKIAFPRMCGGMSGGAVSCYMMR